jgi:hypothetical protein
MTPDEIKTKSAELAAFYTAKANGRTLQIEYSDGWKDQVEHVGPTIGSDLSRWRVKPGPQRMWETPSATPFRTDSYVRTYHQDEADEWRVKGYRVTEWQEVIP